MQLRDHPLMQYRGVPNWPPVWTLRRGDRNGNIRGEVGVVRDVFLPKTEPLNRLFLIMDHQGNEYIGCVLFSDVTFCGQIFQLLRNSQGKTVVQLGDLEVGHLA